jgi:hypothetical protein
MIQPSGKWEQARQDLRDLSHDYKGPEGDNEYCNDGVGQRQKVLDLQLSQGREAERTKQVDKICRL